MCEQTPKSLEAIDKFMRLLACAMFLVSFASISAQVFLRYIIKYGLPWSEELARYLNISVVLLGSGLVIREGGEGGGHPRIGIFYELFSQKWQKIIDSFFNLLVIVFLVILIWQGISLCIFSWNDFTPALRIRWTYPYLSLPLGGLFMLFHQLVEWRNSSLKKNGFSS